jgi:hypothetical protein
LCLELYVYRIALKAFGHEIPWNVRMLYNNSRNVVIIAWKALVILYFSEGSFAHRVRR